MADSQYPYPPDRFDEEADSASFHGAHRAEEPFWRQNLLYIIIIGAAVVMLVVLLFLIGGMGGNGDERAEDPTTPAASESSEEAPADGEEATTEEEPAPEPDLSTPVLVVNAGGINGLAGTWEETLEGEGWTEVGVATADNTQEEPVVFYRDEADAESAQALAQQVGAGEARQSDEYDARITFVAVDEPGADAEGEDGGGEDGGEG
ncbi:LytR C-terminal domain-containing protein [Brachybacterium sp. GCM10030267]|uniref:LytR C-terminal domain-containing protein n=1 Tax=unclassified Brachybacterium TaxID=2623841 RepID=UPI003605B722